MSDAGTLQQAPLAQPRIARTAFHPEKVLRGSDLRYLTSPQALATPSRTKMFATLSILFVALPLLHSKPTTPICQNPPAAASSVPNLASCRDLVEDVFTAAQLDGNEPVLWSRNPSASVRHHKLPFSFTDPLGPSDCEFIVDELRQGSEDSFPTKLIAEKADELVLECLERGIRGAPTIGAVAVGPKRAIVVILTKNWETGDGLGGGLLELNTTNVTLVGPGNLAGLRPDFVGDG